MRARACARCGNLHAVDDRAGRRAHHRAKIVVERRAGAGIDAHQAHQSPSGDRKHHTSLTTAGNSHVRWLLIQAAWGTSRCLSPNSRGESCPASISGESAAVVQRGLIRGELAFACDADVATPDWELPRADLCAQQHGCTPRRCGRVQAVELDDSSAAALRSLRSALYRR